MRDNLCCCVCLKEEPFDNNPIINCDGRSCNTSVHKNCYGIQQIPDGAWFCQKCISQERSARVRCELCPSRDGALKHTNKGGWCHIICALFVPGVEFLDKERLETISIDKISTDKMNKICTICEKNSRLDRASIGACIQCVKAGCKVMFHVTCAQTLGLLTQTVSCKEGVRYIAYCSMHKHKTRHRDFTIRLSNSLQSPGKYDKQKLRHSSPPQLEKSDEDCCMATTTTNSEELSSENDKTSHLNIDIKSINQKINNISAPSSLSTTNNSHLSSSSSIITNSASNSFEEQQAPEISAGTVPIKYENISSKDVETTTNSTSSTTVPSQSSCEIPLIIPPPPPPSTTIISTTSTSFPIPSTSSSSNTPIKQQYTPHTKSSSSPLSTSSLSTIPASSTVPSTTTTITSTTYCNDNNHSINKSNNKRTIDSISNHNHNNNGLSTANNLQPPTKKEKIIKKEKKEESVKSEKIKKPRRPSGKHNADKKVESKLAELLSGRGETSSSSSVSNISNITKNILPSRPKSLLHCISTASNSQKNSSFSSGLNSKSGNSKTKLEQTSMEIVSKSSQSSSSSSSRHVSSSIPNVTTNNSVSGGGGGGSTCQSMEELLEWQWDQAGSVLMQQAADASSDIASLLSCLHDLKNENEQLVSKQLKLSQRRDHLKAVNAKLEIQLLNKKQILNSTNTTSTSTTSTTSSSNSNQSISNPSKLLTTTNSTQNNNNTHTKKAISSLTNNNIMPKQQQHIAPPAPSSKPNTIPKQPVLSQTTLNSIIIPTTGGFITATPLNGVTSGLSQTQQYPHPTSTTHYAQYPHHHQQQQQIYQKPTTSDIVAQLFNSQLQSQLVAAVTQQQQQQQQHQDLVSLIPPPPSTPTTQHPHQLIQQQHNNNNAHNVNMELLYQAINKKQQLQKNNNNTNSIYNTSVGAFHPQQPQQPQQQSTSSSSASSTPSSLLANSVVIPQMKIPSFPGIITNNNNSNSNILESQHISEKHLNS